MPEIRPSSSSTSWQQQTATQRSQDFTSSACASTTTMISQQANSVGAGNSAGLEDQQGHEYKTVSLLSCML